MPSILSADHFHNEVAAFEYVESKLWPDGPICPHCGAVGDKIGRLKGKTTRIGLRKCYDCRKPFTVRIGTIFEDSHLPLRLWLQAIYLFCASKKGISTRQLQRTLDCGMKTAWFLGHRIREAMKRSPEAAPIGGGGATIEVDVTYLGRKPGAKARRGGGSNMNAVLSLVQRQGEVRSFHVPNVYASTLRTVIANHAYMDSRYMSDEHPSTKDIGWNFASHGYVKHSRGEYVRGDVYTNTIEGYFGILKRGVYGVYQHVSSEHLKRYLAEFDFRYSNRAKLGVDDVERADRALAGVKGKRLTYQTTAR